MFKKISRLSAAGLCMMATAFAPTACSDDPEELPAVEIELSLAPASLEFDAEGAAARTVEVTTNAEHWKALPDDDWVTVTPAENAFEVTVADWNGDKERTSSVTVTAADKTERVTVVQRAKAEVHGEYYVEDENFTLEVTDIASDRMTVAVVAKDKEMRWWTNLMQKAFLDRDFGGSVAEYVRKKIENDIQMYGIENLESILNNSLLWDEDTYTYEDLFAQTQWVAYAIGVNLQGELVTEPLQIEVSTLQAPEVVMTGVTFEVTAEEIGKGAMSARIIPSDKEQLWYADCIEKSLYEEYGATPEGAAKCMYDRLVALAIDRLGFDNMEQFYDAAIIWQKGDQTLPFDELTAGTDYCIVAAALDSFCRVCSEAAVLPFRTKEQTLSDNEFDIQVSEINAGGATVTVTPTIDDDPYYYDIMPAGEIASLSDEELVALIEEENGSWMKYSTYTGQHVDVNTKLEMDTDYTVVVFGYDSGITTEVSRVDFRTLRGGDPADCTFTIEVAVDGLLTAHLSIAPSDASVAYFFGMSAAADYVDDATTVEANRQRITDQAAAYGIDLAEFVTRQTRKGSLTMTYDLLPETEYVFYAYAMGSDAGALSPVAAEHVTTGKVVVGTATCEVSFEKYFDGTALSQYDEKYQMYYDAMVVPVTVSHSGEAVHWYVTITRGDMTDTNMYSDMFLIKKLFASSFSHPITDADEAILTAGYTVPSTLLAVAVDADGNYGPLYRLAAEFPKEGAAPVEEFDAYAAPSR